MVNNEEFDQDNLRGTRRWFGRVGLGLIGAVAATLSSSRSASADGYHYSCCHLANPRSSGPCASGTTFMWSCCAGGRITRCYECWDTRFAQPADCWNGYFIKSWAQTGLQSCG